MSIAFSHGRVGVLRPVSISILAGAALVLAVALFHTVVLAGALDCQASAPGWLCQIASWIEG